MTPRLAILSGARAGAVEPLAGTVTSIGKHPTCRVRLDADADIEVSNRHAVIHQKDDAWTVRDLGSIHGTYLNGTRISREEPLNDGDLLRLGAGGPEIQFLLSDRAPVAEPSREPVVAQPKVPALSPEEVARVLEEEQAGQLARDLAAAAARRRIIRIASAATLGFGLLVAGAWGWQRQAARKAERAAYQLDLARADSLISSAPALAVSQPAMRASFDSARRVATVQRSALEDAGPNPSARAPIMKALETAVRRQRDIADAAALAPAVVGSQSTAAVGLVMAQYADGRTVLATGFAVRRDGTGGVLLTTRNALVTGEGEAPVEVLVRIPGEASPLPATIVALHGVEDVALLRVQNRGGIPVVQGLGWRDPAIEQGRPMVIIGYPPPIEVPASGDWRQASPFSTTVTATAARVASGFITADGWGAPLGAGSPAIDAEGLVIGLVSTAAPSAAGRLYDVVPVKFALELLDQLQ